MHKSYPVGGPCFYLLLLSGQTLMVYFGLNFTHSAKGHKFKVKKIYMAQKDYSQVSETGEYVVILICLNQYLCSDLFQLWIGYKPRILFQAKSSKSSQKCLNMLRQVFSHKTYIKKLQVLKTKGPKSICEVSMPLMYFMAKIKCYFIRSLWF